MVHPPYSQLARLISESSRLVVFTGAGISTESGIPDYRSQGGLWDRYRPIPIDEFLASEEARVEYWRRKRELLVQFRTARPNAAHAAVARLHGRGTLLGVITQNIDGLHQSAGVPAEKVLELHGTNRITKCLSCAATEPWERTLERLEAGPSTRSGSPSGSDDMQARGETSPRCPACGGIQKPATVSFGESLDPRVLQDAAGWTQRCDAMLVVGSTLLVEPAASLPRAAKSRGARLAIVNLSETPMDGEADVLVRGKAGEVLGTAVPEFLES